MTIFGGETRNFYSGIFQKLVIYYWQKSLLTFYYQENRFLSLEFNYTGDDVKIKNSD